MKKIITEGRLAKIFSTISILLFAVFFCFSLGETWINDYDLVEEYVSPMKDSVLLNLFWLSLVLLGACLWYRWQRKREQKVNMDLIACVVSVLAGVFCIYWVGVTDVAPQADQFYICSQAESFENGNYEGLQQGQYAGLFRHQLGQITFIRFLFKVFGNGNYQVFQYLNAFMVPVLIYSGYEIVKRLSGESRAAGSLYMFLMSTCVPLYCYVPFVYGEMISTALTIFAAWMLMWCFEKFSVVKIILLSLALGAAVQFRKNTLIFIIAFVIVIGIRLCGEWDWKLPVILCSIFCSILVFQAYINLTYEKLIPENSQAVPSTVYIAMGVNDDNGRAGWHNYYDQLAMAENDYDVAKTKLAVKEYLYSFWETNKNDPAYLADFYYRKLASQWNAPMYQCLAMNNNFVEEPRGLAEEVYFGVLREPLEAEMNLHQLVVYGGICSLLIFVRNRWLQIQKYLLLIGVFGGFLFSVIWEAKTRYVFPYYLALLPYAAVGIYELIKWLNAKIDKRFRKDTTL